MKWDKLKRLKRHTHVEGVMSTGSFLESKYYEGALETRLHACQNWEVPVVVVFTDYTLL